MYSRNAGEQAVRPIFVAVCALVVAWYFFDAGVEKQAANDMPRIESQAVKDMVREYGIANRTGNPVDVCVHAGLVSAAALQAKDSEVYEHWKRIESDDCARAGLPR
jgi:hypothetical protein